MFIHCDNATKQLDSVYDIKLGPGKAFLHRINLSGFDMTNVSTAYRSGPSSEYYPTLTENYVQYTHEHLSIICCSRMSGHSVEISLTHTVSSAAEGPK